MNLINDRALLRTQEQDVTISIMGKDLPETRISYEQFMRKQKEKCEFKS